MKRTVLKKYFFRKLIIALFLALFFVFSPLSAGRAQAWMDAIIAEAIREVYETVKAFMVGSAKQMALRALNQEVNFLVTGRSSQGAMFVTDWQDYLVTQPNQKAKVYMNAYIDQATAGRGSLSQYIPAGSEGFNLAAGNYMNSLKVGAQNTVVNPADPKVTYVGNPSQMFAQGNFRNLSLYLSGINNPWAFNLNAQQKMQEVQQNNQLAAQTKAIAGQGYLGKEVDGKTVTPGSTVASAVSNAQDLGNKIIAGAQDLPSVITAVVSKIITTSITQGIGAMQSRVHSEVANVKNQTTGQMNAAVGQYGPGAQYVPSWTIGATSGGSGSAGNCPTGKTWDTESKQCI